MGSAASVPPSDAPALSREQYIEEHHRFWDLSQKQEWAEVYKLVKSQTSVGALNALGEANYQNCARISCRAIAKITASPKDFDEIVEMLCRCAAAAGWSAGTAACFVTHSTKRDAIREEVLRQAAGPLADAGAEAQAAAMLEEIAKQEGGAAGHLGYAVLMASRSCMAEKKDDLALKLLNAYLPKNKPPEPYDAGDLLALWYALRWRDSGRKATKVGKMAICIFKSSHIKIIVDDGGEVFDGGVSHWEDEQELREQTVPEIMRDWRLWSDAMCFLTDGAIAFEPILVDACWDFMPKAHKPFWDSKYVRCISQSNFHEKDFVDIMRAWEEKYMAEKGGESDILGFHLLYPAKRPDLKVDVVMGGIATNTISHRAFKGRPFYMDEGVLWTHHHRVFWMFHESHHKYESEFQDQFDFAELIKKSDHPMFMKELWMDEFKGENEVFPGSHWHGENEFDWYVQCITRRLKEMSPSLADCWLSWWGGKEEEALGAYHDWVSEHHVMWEAFQAQDWPKVLEVYESQLRAMCEEKLGEQNYKNVVNMSVKALVASEKALDAEVLAAIKTGLKVLELEADQAGELMHHLSAEQKQEVLKMLPSSEKVKKRVAKQQKAISIIDDHHQMWDAYQNQEWHKVLEHQELQVSQQARERLGDGNYQNCFRMLFQAMGSGLTSPKDVNRAVDLLRKGMETTGWGIEVFEPLLSNHARKFQVMQPFAPSEDAEGKYHDFVSEHHAMWDAYQKQDWEKVCSFVDSQLRPLCLARLGEQNYGNVTRMAVQSLASAGRALDGAVLAALKKGLEVLGSGAERAAEFTNGLPPEQAAELLKLL